MTMSAERREEVAAWFAARRRIIMTVEERAAFEAWSADPENLKALNAATNLWDKMAVLKDAQEPAPPVAAGRPARWRLATVAACLGAALLGSGAITVYASEPLAFAKTTATVVGEQRAQTLSDGSVINLNVATRVDYRLRARSRTVRLREGQVLFAVQEDNHRPFRVWVGDYEVRALGRAFDVKYRDGEAQIQVCEGAVAIAFRNGPQAGRIVARLEAGQKIRLPPSGDLNTPQPLIQRVAVQDVAEWRVGTIAYEDASLAEVVADLNRVFPQSITIADKSLASRRVNLRLQLTDRANTVRTLNDLLGEDIEGRKRADVLR